MGRLSAVCGDLFADLFARVRQVYAGRPAQIWGTGVVRRVGRRAGRAGGAGRKRGGGGLFGCVVRRRGHALFLCASGGAALSVAVPARRERVHVRACLFDGRAVRAHRTDGQGGIFAVAGLRLYRRGGADHARAGKPPRAGSGPAHASVSVVQCQIARVCTARFCLFRGQFSRGRGHLSRGRPARADRRLPAQKGRRRRIYPRSGAPATPVFAVGARILAFFAQTVYNQDRNDGLCRAGRAVVPAVLFLSPAICGGAERAGHACRVVQGSALSLLSDGHYALGSRSRRVYGHHRQGIGRGHSRHVFRRSHARDERSVRGGVSAFFGRLSALRVCHRRRCPRNGLAPRIAARARTTARCLFACLSSLCPFVARRRLRRRARRTRSLFCGRRIFLTEAP